MNDKYMTLLEKTNEQLDKELRKRGFVEGVKSGEHSNVNGKIFGGYFTPERAIAEIIYKDAFDAGRSLKAEENERIKEEEYLIEDDYNNHRWKITLTSSQIRFLKWLDENGLLSGGACFREFNKSSYKEVGRI